jgi:hypothetical protein
VVATDERDAIGCELGNSCPRPGEREVGHAGQGIGRPDDDYMPGIMPA